MLTRDLFAIAKFLVLFAAKLNFLYCQNYKMEFDLNNSLIQRAAAAVDIFDLRSPGGALSDADASFVKH